MTYDRHHVLEHRPMLAVLIDHKYRPLGTISPLHDSMAQQQQLQPVKHVLHTKKKYFKILNKKFK